MNDLLKLILLGVGGYLLYEKFFAAPSVPASTPAPGGTALPTCPSGSSLVGDKCVLTSSLTPGQFGPQAGSSLSGSPLDLRNGLIACWLGAQTPPKPWDATANPSLSVTDWDNLLISCNSPSAKPVGGSQSVNADAYVNLRLAGNLGLSGLGVRPSFVHPRGRNLTPGTPRRRYFPAPNRNYVRAGTPMTVRTQPVLPRRRA